MKESEHEFKRGTDESPCLFDSYRRQSAAAAAVVPAATVVVSAAAVISAAAAAEQNDDQNDDPKAAAAPVVIAAPHSEYLLNMNLRWLFAVLNPYYAGRLKGCQERQDR